MLRFNATKRLLRLWQHQNKDSSDILESWFGNISTSSNTDWSKKAISRSRLSHLYVYHGVVWAKIGSRGLEGIYFDVLLICFNSYWEKRGLGVFEIGGWVYRVSRDIISIGLPEHPLGKPVPSLSIARGSHSPIYLPTINHIKVV